MNSKDIIAKKVEDFSKNEKIYTSKDFQETETRNRFIDPLFEALGWNLNQTHLVRNLWDVHREYSQKDNSSTKKPDYAFRIDAKLKFFVEAKAPHVPLTDKDPVFQAKRYAYSTNGKAPIIILTDFEEFRVFNALQKPIYENPTQGILKEFDFGYLDYLDKWDLLVENFSRDAVHSGSIDRLRGKISKNTKKLDEEFLDEMIAWRENLAKHIAIKNESLTVDELNESVQRILDRLIFIRQLEDRNIVDENTLFSFAKKENLYKEILPLFGELNGKYNGLLFKPHFSEKLIVEDKILKDTILDLCYPRSPFQFDVIEPEILGRIYERFLGSKIRLTEGHHAKVEEKLEVRHAGGVYYTPEYIVNYIVKETVGKKINSINHDVGTGLKPVPTSEKPVPTPEDISKIKILDPACGSGSFLLGAYQFLMDYHKEFYKKDKSKKYKDDFFLNSDGEIKLTTKKKGEILLNNIFGVDIDREATEVAILSLYLKLLEDGLEDDSFLFLKGKVLPDMTANIKCGNSLISRDDLYDNNMFANQKIPINSKLESVHTTNLPKLEHSHKTIAYSKLNGFDWETEFPEVFNHRGTEKKNVENGNFRSLGFDCIIGNPPYIKTQEMQKFQPEVVELYKKIFTSGKAGNLDIYVLFIEKGLKLLNENGLLGYICPHKFFNSNYGSAIRKMIKEKKNIQKILHFGVNQIFENATTYTCLLFLGKNTKDEFDYFEFKDETKEIQENVETGINYFPVEFGKLSQENWVFVNSENDSFLDKMSKGNLLLQDITTNIFQGPKAGADPVFIIQMINKGSTISECYSSTIDANLKIENSIIKPYVKGKYIKRYFIEKNNEYIIFPYSNDGKLIDESNLKEKYPLAYEYLSNKENKKILLAREEGRFKNIWWSYSRPQNMQILDSFKLLTPFNAFNSSYSLDDQGDFIFSAGVSGAYGILLKKELNISYYYLLGLLNSKPLDRFLKTISTALRGAYYSYENKYIRQLPIYIPDPTDKEKFPLTQKIEEHVKQILELRHVGMRGGTSSGDAEFLEKKIDEMVEKLYGVG